MKFFVYVVPLPLFAVMWMAWLLRTPNSWFVCYVMMLPLLYGYIVPGIATNVLKKWAFKGPLLFGNIFVHHGFIYASNMSMLLFLAFGRPSSLVPIGLMEGIRLIVCAGGLHGFVLWIRDTQLLRAGMVEIHSPFSQQEQSAEEVSFRYAPVCFFVLGMSYAAGCVLAYNELVVNRNISWASMLWLISAGLTMMIVLSSVAYGVAERTKCKKAGA